jgi:hypothetical protein
MSHESSALNQTGRLDSYDDANPGAEPELSDTQLSLLVKVGGDALGLGVNETIFLAENLEAVMRQMWKEARAVGYADGWAAAWADGWHAGKNYDDDYRRAIAESRRGVRAH